MEELFSTPRLCIRPFVNSDLTEFARYRGLPEVARFQSWQDYSYADAKALFDGTDYSIFGQWDNWFQLAVCDKNTGLLLGDLAVHFVDEEQVEIGYTLAPENQGQGYAFEALKGLLDYLFIELNKHRVYALTDVDNMRSVKLLERIGMRREGHFIQAAYYKGQWCDEYQFALLARDYLSV